jgi:hypothetical protein
MVPILEVYDVFLARENTIQERIPTSDMQLIF